jgi:Tol biopolymer transport system component
MKRTTQRKGTPRAVNLLAVLVLIGAALLAGSFGAAYAQDGAIPWLTAFPEWEYVEAVDWAVGLPVHLAIDDPNTPDVVPDYQADTTTMIPDWEPNPERGWAIFPLADYDLKVGDRVVMTGGEFTIEHVVRNLAITGVDMDADRVTGTADPRAQLQVWVHGQPPLDVAAKGNGYWQAKFAGVYDIVPGTGGRAWIIAEGGNATAVEWTAPPPPPTPWLTAFPEWEYVEAYHWAVGANVHLTIDDPDTEQSPDYQDDTTAFIPDWEPDPERGWAVFPLAGYDLKPGDVVVMTSGGIEIMHVVRNLAITGVDMEANTVAGTADPGVPLQAWVHGQPPLDVLAGEDGTWLADFTGVYDIVPGTAGRAWIITEGGNATAVEWTTPPPPPSPWLIAFPENEAVEGWEWPEDATVYLTIDNAPEGFIREGTAEVTSWGDPRTYVRIEFGDAYNLKAGDEVTLTDEFGTTITHKVQNLSVTVVNTKADTVAGTANAGAVVQVWPHEFDQIATVQVTAGDDGAWLADFDGLFDVVIGTGGRSQIVVDGNATAVDWDARQTYDIYAYDPLTGTTQQITYLANRDEYNPSWSPNGKKVAHDVVKPDGSHGIYITDVKTGVSTPLVGAEDGGNDAVWSPNGKRIAFDRHWVGDSSLYIVPSTGGAATLVRGDAVSADWAPNGKRLVFQQPSDGSIRTIPVDGGKGGETIIAASGANPVWSPDGNWIAYDYNGDIWKVQVNVQGRTFGEPIQVTSGPFSDGQPSWSADSATIAYHTGFTSDWDIWTVPAAGGMPTWLTGAPEFGDYDPAYAKNSSNVAYASFSPEGQAARLWVAAYTYDPPVGTWGEGDHHYHFEAGSETTPEIPFNVSSEAPLYDGFVLLRPAALRARVGDECLMAVSAIRPEQATRFHAGYLSPEGTYQEAQTFFDSLTARAIWDDGMSAELARHEIRPYSPDGWWQYVCTYTK